jgi:hypothetical protein
MNMTLDLGEFDTINARIVLIFRIESESIMTRFDSGFMSVIVSRGDSSVTKIDSILYLERISEFFNSSRKVVLPTPSPHTRAIY